MPRINLDDFIDPDEGREFIQQAFYQFAEPCENCGKPCKEGGRVWIPGFDFLGCDDCAEEAKAVIFAEQNCQNLHDFIIRSKSVQQVRIAMRQHEATCPNCNPALRKPAQVAEMPAPAAKPEREAA